MSALLAKGELVEFSVLRFRYPVYHSFSARARCDFHQSHVPQAVFGFFQYAFCMMDERESPANARDIAPPDLNECRENSCFPPACLA